MHQPTTFKVVLRSNLLHRIAPSWSRCGAAYERGRYPHTWVLHSPPVVSGQFQRAGDPFPTARQSIDDAGHRSRPISPLYPCLRLQTRPSGLAPTFSSQSPWLSEPPTGLSPSSSAVLPRIHTPQTKWRQPRLPRLLPPLQLSQQAPLLRLLVQRPQCLLQQALQLVSRYI